MADSSKEELKFFLKKFKEKIPCRNMRSYVLGDITSRDLLEYENYFPLINNILNLAYIYTYSCYRQKNEDEQFIHSVESDSNTNLLRVFNVLKKIYFEYEVTNELEQFVLLDLNYTYSSCRSFIPDLFNDNADVSLNEMFSMVKNYKSSLRAVGDGNLEYIRSKLLALLDFFPFLSSKQLVFVERPYGSCWAFRKLNFTVSELVAADNNTMSEDSPLNYSKGDFLARGILHTREVDGNLQFFYLKAIEDLRENAVFKFSSTSDYEAFTISLDESEKLGDKKYDIDIVKSQYINMITGQYNSDDRSVNQIEMIDDIFYINYKYIKNLAYAIVDSISIANDPEESVKKMLVHKYLHKFPQLFKLRNPALSTDESNCDIHSQNWDNIIAMLLLQDSPSAVLRCIIMKKSDIYYKIAENLCKRFNGKVEMLSGDVNKLRERAEDIVRRSRPALAKYTRNASDIRGNLLVEAKCQIILNSLNRAISGDGERDYTVGNINTNITTLQYMQNTYNVEEKIRFVNFTLCDALKKLICFYRGVFAYGEGKKGYNRDSINYALTADAVKAHKDNILEGFYAEVGRARDEILAEGCKDDPVGLLKKFIQVCLECYEHTGTNSYTISESGKNLYVALGKNEILNLKDFLAILPADWENAVINESNVDNWMRVTLDILRYLKLGANTKNTNEYSEELFSEKAIYPFLSVYSRSSYNEDKCLVSTFSISIDINGDNRSDIDVNVNVLTEFPYELQMQYYCLPNICTSNKKWWIDPVIINYHRFCEKIKEIC